ncbi:hypothetical protein [Actinoplanes couchii]|nr:hypothetical protein [Actinoplanes couchii]MDR6319887.1 hypothetical protein [Actinoplanes couchii]
MIIRDAELPRDEEAAREARHRAGLGIVAASNEAVYICATQRIIPVQLVVKAYSRSRVVEDNSGWDGVFDFVVDFPSGLLHFGDTFHCADGLELPAGAGRLAVTVLHAGREAVFRTLRAIDHLDGPERERLIDGNADIERYLVIVAPVGFTGHPNPGNGGGEPSSADSEYRCHDGARRSRCTQLRNDPVRLRPLGSRRAA